MPEDHLDLTTDMDEPGFLSNAEPEIDDLDIELLDVSSSIENKPRPQVVKWLGEDDSGHALAYFDAGSLESLVKHGISDLSREVGGVLVGKLYDDGGEYVTVTGAVPARFSRGTMASLTFTHESWQQMMEDMDRSFPGTRIIGWYHTHPGLGIFLSGHDMFIQKNFFRQPYQVAVVFDSVGMDIGLFCNEPSGVIKCDGLPICGNKVYADKLAFDLRYGGRRGMGAALMTMGTMTRALMLPGPDALVLRESLPQDPPERPRKGKGKHIDRKA